MLDQVVAVAVTALRQAGLVAGLIVGASSGDQVPTWLLWVSNGGQAVGGLGVVVAVVALRQTRKASGDTRAMVAMEAERRAEERQDRLRREADDALAKLFVEVVVNVEPTTTAAPMARALWATEMGAPRRRYWLVVENRGKAAADGLVVELKAMPGEVDGSPANDPLHNGPADDGSPGIRMEAGDLHAGSSLRAGDRRVIPLLPNSQSRRAMVVARWHDGRSGMAMLEAPIQLYR